jgi:integrase/recombinase XerD
MPDPRNGQVTENPRSLTRDSLRKSVTREAAWDSEAPSLYAGNGARKYLNQSERRRVLAAVKSLQPDHALFALVLAWTGARISEVLALTPQSFQVEMGIVTIVTLKRRRFFVREVPIPPRLMVSLDRAFQLQRLQANQESTRKRLWLFSRMTAWRIVKRAMANAGVAGLHACPKGLRHAFGVGSLSSGVPINLVQRWMGHARLSTTAIYLNLCGPEEFVFARLFWRSGSFAVPRKERSRLFKAA